MPRKKFRIIRKFEILSNKSESISDILTRKIGINQLPINDVPKWPISTGHDRVDFEIEPCDVILDRDSRPRILVRFGNILFFWNFRCGRVHIGSTLNDLNEFGSWTDAIMIHWNTQIENILNNCSKNEIFFDANYNFQTDHMSRWRILQSHDHRLVSGLRGLVVDTGEITGQNERYIIDLKF